MRPVVIALSVSFVLMFVFIFGCTQSNIEEKKGTTADFGVLSIQLLNDTPIRLGASINVKIRTLSTANLDSKYNVIVKLNGKKLAQYTASGNTTKTISIPAYYNGEMNLSAQVFPVNKSKYIDKNATNNFQYTSMNIIPYETIFNTTHDNSTKIDSDRLYATKIRLNNTSQIQTIGAFVVKTTSLSDPSSVLYFSVYPDYNNTPSNESIMNASTSLGKIPYDWRFILLQSTPSEFEPGDYWIVFSVHGDGYVSLACSDNETAYGNLRGAKYSKGIKWKEASCTPYVLLSSLDALASYKQFISIH